MESSVRRQHRSMRFSMSTLLSFRSNVMTLNPGDLITARQWGSSTVSGGGGGRGGRHRTAREPGRGRPDQAAVSSAIAGIVASTVPLLVLGFISHARWRLPPLPRSCQLSPLPSQARRAL